MVEFEKLVIRYNSFIEGFVGGKKNLYHLKSLNNFLTHFEKIKTDRDKILVIEILNEYLDFVELNKVETKALSKELYLNYIHEAGVIYVKDAGFIFLIGFELLIFLIVILNIVFIVLSFHILSIILVNTISFGYFIYIFSKSKSNRVFGISW